MAGGGRTWEVVGLASVVLGVQFSVLANTTVKLLADVPMLQLMQARFLLQWLVSFSLCLAMRRRGHTIHILGRPGCRRGLAVRACCFAVALGCLWCALRIMPMGEATAIIYLNPVVCGLLATDLLGEKLGWRFTLQAGLSCLGVVLVVNPFGGSVAGTSGDLDLGVALAITSCVTFAISNVLTSVLNEVHPLEVQHSQDLLTAFVLMPTALLMSGQGWDLSAWGWEEAMHLVIFTLAGLGASFFVIVGYSMAPASKAALFTYLEVPSSFASQVLFFGEVPSTPSVLGATLIVGAAAARCLLEVRDAQAAAAGDTSADFMLRNKLSPALVPALTSPVQLILNRGPVDAFSPLPSPLCFHHGVGAAESLTLPASPGLKQPLLQASAGEPRHEGGANVSDTATTASQCSEASACAVHGEAEQP